VTVALHDGVPGRRPAAAAAQAPQALVQPHRFTESITGGGVHGTMSPVEIFFFFNAYNIKSVLS
jgi:hypothetical protein